MPSESQQVTEPKSRGTGAWLRLLEFGSGVAWRRPRVQRPSSIHTVPILSRKRGAWLRASNFVPADHYLHIEAYFRLATGTASPADILFIPPNLQHLKTTFSNILSFPWPFLSEWNFRRSRGAWIG